MKLLMKSAAAAASPAEGDRRRHSARFCGAAFVAADGDPAVAPEIRVIG